MTLTGNFRASRVSDTALEETMRSKLGLIVLAALIVAGCAPFDSSGETGPRGLSVQGSASVSLEPDRVTFTVGVDAQDKSVSGAFERVSSRVAAMIAALEKAGVRAEEIQTSRVALHDVRDRDNSILGYQASNRVTVTRNDLTNVGELLQAAVDAGANGIDNLWFSVADPSVVSEEGLQLAFENARRKAAKLAELSGAKLGKVLAISDGTSGPQPYPAMRMESFAGKTISAGTEEITFQVSVTFELE